jgi:heat shock protein HtpX
MLAVYPALILILAWACIFVVMALTQNTGYTVTAPDFSTIHALTLEVSMQFAPFIIGGLLAWFTISFFFHHHMIMKLSGAHSVNRKDEPELYNLLENMCIAQGMPMTRLNIIETHGRNAFASGINQQTYTVTVTRGLIDSLQKDELEAVLAHELTHIINRDVRLMMVTIVFTGMVALAFQLVANYFRYNHFIIGRSSHNKNGGSMIIIAIAIFIILGIGYLLTTFMRFFISRKREYMADAGAAQITKNPEAMMRALMRIAHRDQMPTVNGDMAMMYIENSKSFMGLFATHPPIEKRIEALAITHNIPVPSIKSLGPAPKIEQLRTSEKPQNPWLISARYGRPVKPNTSNELWSSYEEQ